MWGNLISWPMLIPDLNKENRMCCKDCQCHSCKPVQAYRSINGCLYSSKEECHRANEKYRQKQIQDQVTKIFKNYEESYYRSYGCILDTGPMVIDRMSKNWKELRDALNRIEE